MNFFIIWKDFLPLLMKLKLTTFLFFNFMIYTALGGSSSSSSIAAADSPSAERHQGSVGAHNFTYYNFVTRRPGASMIILKTYFGDADLYVSQRENKHQPTFDMSNYDLHSTSCGLDYVEIEDLLLPVNIGIYGHPSYPFSNYTLAILVTKPGGTIDDLRRWLDESGLTLDELPSYIDKYSANDDGGELFNEMSFGELCLKLVKFLFELVLEILL